MDTPRPRISRWSRAHRRLALTLNLPPHVSPFGRESASSWRLNPMRSQFRHPLYASNETRTQALCQKNYLTRHADDFIINSASYLHFWGAGNWRDAHAASPPSRLSSSRLTCFSMELTDSLRPRASCRASIRSEQPRAAAKRASLALDVCGAELPASEQTREYPRCPRGDWRRPRRAYPQVRKFRRARRTRRPVAATPNIRGNATHFS